jgi:hypothetical protein
MALAVQACYLKTKLDGTDALAISTFESSQVTLPLGGEDVTVQQISRFPREGSSELIVHLAHPTKFGFLVRRPAWAVPLNLRVNSQPIERSGSQSWAVVPVREWKDGDRISLSFNLAQKWLTGEHGNAGRVALTWGPFVMAVDKARYRELSVAGPVGFRDDVALKPETSFVVGTVLPGVTDPKSTVVVFSPFADAGSTGGQYETWLREPGYKRPPDASVLADGQESRSRRGNQNGSIIDGDPWSFVVTFDGTSATADWYAVTLRSPVRIARVLFRHGENFHDGGWFDTTVDKPRIQAQMKAGGDWLTVGELAGYPDTTATENGGLTAGQAFECHLGRPVSAVALRVIGRPSSGDNSRQAFSSCAELEAFSP